MIAAQVSAGRYFGAGCDVREPTTPGVASGHNHLNQIAFRGYNDDRLPVTGIPRAGSALLALLFRVADRLDEARSHARTRLHLLELTKAGYTATRGGHFTNADKRGRWLLGCGRRIGHARVPG